MKTLTLAAVAVLTLAGAARAEVTDKSAAGFEVVETATVAASPAKVWDMLMHPARWWSPKHTWSGDAKNLAFDPSGCFCETLKRGAVRHMMVIYADGATQLRLAGVLDNLAALLIGSFNGVSPEHDALLETEVPKLALEMCPERVAIASRIAYGHIPRRYTLPVGGVCTVELETGTFTLARG